MSDRHHWDLRGPVRTLEIHRSDHTIIEFRPDGAISRHWHRNPDSSEWTAFHTFDDAGRLIATRSETHQTIYEYDHAGRLACHKDGNNRTIESYTYDTEGRKTKTYFVDLSVQRPNTTHLWAVEGSKASYSAPNAAKLTTAYDPAGRPTAVLFYDAADALVSQLALLYDQSGNLIEESQTHVVSPFSSFEEHLEPAQLEALRGLLSGPISRRIHRYDALGHCVETRSSMFGQLGNHRETMEYNSYGDLIAQTSEEENREVGLNDEGQLVDRAVRQSSSQARFLYEYDARGNWTSKVTKHRPTQNDDFSVTSTELRTLTYFDPI